MHNCAAFKRVVFTSQSIKIRYEKGKTKIKAFLSPIPLKVTHIN